MGYGEYDNDDYRRYRVRKTMPEGRSYKDRIYYDSRMSGKSQFEQRAFEEGKAKVNKKGGKK